MSSHSADEHAEPAGDRAGDAVAPAAWSRGCGSRRRSAVARRVAAAAWPSVRQHEHERERRDQACCASGSPLERVDEVVDEQHRDRDARREAGPRQRPGDEPEAVAAVRRPRDRKDDDDVEEVHSAGVSRRAWVRKPVWATMRWSGRTD